MSRSGVSSGVGRRRSIVLAASVGLGLVATTAPAVATTPAPQRVASAASAAASTLTPFDAVDQFIGTRLDTTENKSNDAYGNTYPGATVPFGMVQPSPTTYKVGETNDLVREKGGYEYTADQIRGFGMTRYSGTGCHTRFGGYEFPTIPFTGALAADGSLPRNPATQDHRSYFLDFSHDDEVSEPGYYAVTTADGTTTELTASRRTALSRFDFSEAAGSTLVLDASGANNRTFTVDLDIDPATRTVSGSMYGTDVCDNGNSYRAYFSTTYDQPFAGHGTWTNGTMTQGSVEASLAGDTNADQRHRLGGWVTFADDAVVTARTGFSYTSVAAAAANAVAETGAAVTTGTFDAVRADARAAWEEALGTVDVTGGTDEQRIKLYTALYHALLQPTIGQDADGRYLGFDGQLHSVEPGHDFFRRINFAGQGWDMYRSQAQLIAMLFPEVASDINRSIMTMVQQTGKWSPGAARMQGDNYQVILSTLDAFGARDYDRQAALESMVRTQTLPATDSTRSDAFQYAATGVVERRKGGQATSRTLEYAVDDFAIAQLAGRLGDDAAYDTFMGRAQNWRQVFDPRTQHVRPRDRSIGFDRDSSLANRGTGQYGEQFNQSTGYQYGWNVPHNIGELVTMRGGRAASTRALDVLMAELDAGAYDKTGNYLSNEAALTTPWVHHWLQSPHKTTDVLHRAVTELYDTTPSGLPGNDDEGALSAWYVFANIGLAPMIYGTANILLSAPMFDAVTLTSVGSDRRYEITAPGAASGARYVTGLEVDGVAQTASWVGEDFARSGGTLAFTMSATPGSWGTGAADVPPSFNDGVDARNNVGTAPAGSRNMGSMDFSDWAFARETLAARGVTPGGPVPFPGTDIEFTWPDTRPGEPDNWIPHGQRVELPRQQASTISFLGLATNGPSTGTAVVEYTDGSTQNVPLTLTDWNAQPTAGNTTLVTVAGRVNANGSSGSGDFRLYATRPAPLDGTRTVAAVRLPQATYNGIMHVFDVALGEEPFVDPNAPTGAPDRIILTSSQDPATSQYVTWRTASSLPLDGKVEVRVAGSDAVTTVDAVEKPERQLNGYPSRSHSAKLTGLTPGTTYDYRVGAGTGEVTWSTWASFTTAGSGDEPFEFLYFGDAQEGIDTVWPRSVSAAWTAAPDADLTLYAGDMVNTSTVEKEWDDWFGGLAGHQRTTTALSTPGNHEVGPEPFMEHYKDTFEYDANGPVAADAGVFADTYGEHLAEVLQDTVTYSDRQGVRFVVLNANRDDICPVTQVPGLATWTCDRARDVWMAMQASWLERVLGDNPHRWSVVLVHQPQFSTGISDSGAFRDEDNWRRYVGPVLERHDVDLVLQGHDHAYGRGSMDRHRTATPGVSTGPVYVVANAGQKQYRAAPDADNVWTRNRATPVVKAQDTSTFQRIAVDGDTLRYESVVTYVEAGGQAPKAPGETLDSFTITRYDDGAKWVTEAGVVVPGDEVPASGVERPGDEPFDPDTFADVVWDDDFESDTLARYDRQAGSEPLPDLAVDTAAGVLRASATTRSWGHLVPPVDGGERWAMIVEPRSFAGTGAGEDSLFVGAAGEGGSWRGWYNHSRRETGYDFSTGTGGRTVGRANGPLSVDPGDRVAFVVDHGEVSSWIEEGGAWRRYNVALASYVLGEDTLASWKPTFSLRLDPGSIAIDRVTVLAGDPVVPAEPVTPAAVTFDDRAGTAEDTYTVPDVEGVEYLVGETVVAAGTYPGTGTVTVTARASGDAPIADGATTTWSHTFSTEGGVDPEPEPDPTVTMTLSATARSYGVSSVVRGTLTAEAGPVSGPVAITVDGRQVAQVQAVAGAFTSALPRTVAAGRRAVTAVYAGAEGFSPAVSATTVTVAKATPRVTLSVMPKRALVRGKRFTAVVRVGLPGTSVTATGRVKVRVAGRTVTARLRDGRAQVRLPVAHKAGRRKVTATYVASPNVRGGSAKAVTIRVVRR
jgi:predicted alpha-1,2-mannosidase